MGEVADMMLDGTLCECCGVWMGDGEAPGYPRRCRDCRTPIEAAFAMKRQIAAKVKCPACGKRVKATGLADHTRAVHSGAAPTQEPKG